MEEGMIERMKDRHVAALLRIAKTKRGLRPFFGTAKGMIALRKEAARRGIYASVGEANEVFMQVTQAMEEVDQWGSKRMY
jgi:hypothetical protein